MQKLSLTVLRLRDFRLMLIARMCVTMALQAQAVIVGWQIYSITKSTFLLGLTGLAEAVPAITGALVAGHVIDTIGRPQFTFRICIGVLTVNTLLFLIYAGGLAPPPGGSLLPLIFTFVFISGLARSFTIPSSFSMLPRIVARTELSGASAWLTSRSPGRAPGTTAQPDFSVSFHPRPSRCEAETPAAETVATDIFLSSKASSSTSSTPHSEEMRMIG